MGLDIDFHIRGTDTAVLEMRNHIGFLEKFFALQTQPVYPGYDDFWVDADILDGVEAALATSFADVDASDDGMSADVFDALRCARTEDLPRATLVTFYRHALRILRRALEDHGRLICSWSA